MVHQQWALLYGKSSTGKIKTWKIRVHTNANGTATIITRYGYENGEKTTSTVTILAGKNIGRANETTPFEQACSEATSKWNKKRDKKYSLSLKELESRTDELLPMLAHDYKKRLHDITWPAYLQPKLNGIRCLAKKVDDDKIHYTSRGGKDFTSIEHLTPHLLRLMQVGEVLDGELFTKDLTFQEITAAVKREKTKSENVEKVEFWVYDIIRPEPFEKRTLFLQGLLSQPGPIVLVPTKLIKYVKQMKKFHSQIVAAGYEGTIIRNRMGGYKLDYRSPDLQKYKDFDDNEFEIIGGRQAIGKDEGTVVFRCRTQEGKEFDCRPTGSHDLRKEYYANLPKLKGKMLTVRHQGWSDDRVPIFPRGLNVRDYE